MSLGKKQSRAEEQVSLEELEALLKEEEEKDGRPEEKKGADSDESSEEWSYGSLVAALEEHGIRQFVGA